MWFCTWFCHWSLLTTITSADQLDYAMFLARTSFDFQLRIYVLYAFLKI